MEERRVGSRHPISLPIRIKWKGEDGKWLVEEGLTENVGVRGALVYLPRELPAVGSNVKLTVTDKAEEFSVNADVLRLERNASHPQAALEITNSFKKWKKQIYDYAQELIAKEKPEELDEW